MITVAVIELKAVSLSDLIIQLGNAKEGFRRRRDAANQQAPRSDQHFVELESALMR